MKKRIKYSLVGLIMLVFLFFFLTATWAGQEEAVQGGLLNPASTTHLWIGPDGKALPFSNNLEAEEFLLTAQMVSSKVIRTGVNTPWKVLLEKDGIQAYAIFRYHNEVKGRERNPGSGSLGRYFRDSYVSELAAYSINELLGMNKIPPTVPRTLKNRSGSLQLWVEEAMSNFERNEKNIIPPDPLAWNRKYLDMRVFDNLINNTDRNQGNLMIDKNWRFWLIDHTRSFARDTTLPNSKEVTQCSRQLWEAIIEMDQAKARQNLASYVTEAEVNAFFTRRTVLIKLIEERIKKMGEDAVIF